MGSCPWQTASPGVKIVNRAKSSTPLTRQSSVIFGLLGGGITEVDGEITGARLPTGQQVLRCLMYHLQSGSKKNNSKWETCKVVLEQVVDFYAKANIPINSHRIYCTKMIQLMVENAKIRAIPIKRRDASV